MNLTTKALWLPAGILLAIFLVMGGIFTWMITDRAEETISNELTQLLASQQEALSIGLSLVTATQAPADAIIGLEGDDDELAKDVVKQVHRLGLDGIYITDLEGKALYSSAGEMPAEISELIKTADRSKGTVSHHVAPGNLVSYAPIYDVDDPVGFLFFDVALNDSLFSYAAGLAEHLGGEELLASERLTKTEQALEAAEAAFITKIMLTIVITLVVGLAIIMAVLGSTSRNIVRPIKELLVLLNKMAAGDFTERANPKGSDEVAQLQHAANATTEQLRAMIQELTGSTEELNGSAGQISNVIETTSAGVNEQKMETEHVATAMNQMAATIQEIARTTGTAAGAADQANTEADTGNRVVSSAISSITNLAGEIDKASEVIDELRQNSDDIGTVLDVIRGIAEQTNLLALNAAIEAARAGEQGRGFAVVADEVRTLAGRTQSSTEEIQAMIERLQSGAQDAVKVMQNSRDRAQETVDQAGKAGESLKVITDSASEISGMNTQIASAAEELGAAAEEVNQKVVSINHIADQATDNANEMVSANQRLNDLADTLRTMTAKFTL